MEILSRGQATKRGPEEWFIGDVYVEEVACATEVSRARAALVHFTPGSRTHWHSHDHGQTIYLTAGHGRCQRQGGPVKELYAGDRVFFEPGEVHWHGAAPDQMMSHLHVQHVGEDGLSTAFFEPVDDEEYGTGAEPVTR
jgi:quercetin dioxygenase-like cupin family protein